MHLHRHGRMCGIAVLVLVLLLPAHGSVRVSAQAGAALEAIDALLTGGKYADAEARARDLLKSVEQTSGAESVEVGAVLNRLAESRLRQGLADADTEQIVTRAMTMLERLAPASEAFASALRNRAWIYEDRGKFADARVHYERALDVLRGVLGPEAPATLLMQKDLAMAYREEGDYGRARTLLEQALAIRSAAAPDSVDVATLQYNLGAVYWEQGEYAAARRSFVTAGEGLSRHLGPTHPHVASSLEALAVIEVAQGQYAEARHTYLRVLAIREQVLGNKHPLVGQTLLNIGDVLLAMGDDEEARRTLERALGVLEQALGPDHPQLSAALTNLGAARDRLGDRAGARAMLARSVVVREKALGPDHAGLVIPLTQLANVLADSGDLPAARAAYARARAIGRRSRGADHPYVASAALQEGIRLAARGDLAAAAPLIEDARRMFAKTLGAGHPDTASAMDVAARVAAVRGDHAQAFDLALGAEAVARRHFQAVAAALSERQALLYAHDRARSQDLAIEVARAGGAPDAAMVDRLWDTVVRSRALLLDEMASRRHALGVNVHPEAQRLAAALSDARARLAQLFVRGPAEGRTTDFARELAEATLARDRAEEALVRASAVHRAEQARRIVGLAQVRASLPPGTALVAFVRHAADVFGGETAPMTARAHAYTAFVLPDSRTSPVMVPLGDTREIEPFIERWRAQVRAEATAPPIGRARRERQYRSIATELRRRVWDPVAAVAGSASRILIVPDAALHLVDFAALPRARGGYLVEGDATLHYLSAERDVAAEPTHSGKGLLALGAPAFDSAPAAPPVAVTAASRLRSDCAVGPGVRFAALPESGREVEAIARLWDGQPDAPLVGRGAEASESFVKAFSPGRRILHLATHGFVLGEGCRPAAGATPTDKSTLAQSPLLGAGLVLAGATRRGGARSADGEDGILTAEEIAALDLNGVEWAVLSACDSGLGEVRAGEGVFGLRRAFQVAGVRTIVMSLWPVDDRAARRWMEALYAARLRAHASTADAVRDAGRRALAVQRQAGGSTHPFYWSGFVAAGDWR